MSPIERMIDKATGHVPNGTASQSRRPPISESSAALLELAEAAKEWADEMTILKLDKPEARLRKAVLALAELGWFDSTRKAPR